MNNKNIAKTILENATCGHYAMAWYFFLIDLKRNNMPDNCINYLDPY